MRALGEEGVYGDDGVTEVDDVCGFELVGHVDGGEKV